MNTISTVKKAGLLFGFWTVIAMLTVSQIYAELYAFDRSMEWGRIVPVQLLHWYVWAVLTPVVVWLGRRIPIERARVAKGAALHVCLSLAVASAHVALAVAVHYILEYESWSNMPFSHVVVGQFYTFHQELLIYWAIVGASWAFEYYNRFRERDLRAQALEAQLASAQLEALRVQLQPHFLFNTLHGIAGLVRDNNNSAAVDMITGLSELLRQALENSGKQEVPLAEELEFTERYLAIQQMRFSDRLTVDVDVASDVLSAVVPNLILQPLVENAVRHGVARKAAAGRIAIRAHRSGDRLCLQVLDDGPGYSPNGNGSSGVRSTGIGLRNTRDRLDRLYGRESTFDVRTRAEGGTEAVVTLPWRLDGDDRQDGAHEFGGEHS